MQNQPQPIQPSDTIFSDQVKISDDHFQTPPQKKTINQLMGCSPVKINLAHIFKTPMSQISQESKSGSKTQVKDEHDDNERTSQKIFSTPVFQKKGPLFTQSMNPNPQKSGDDDYQQNPKGKSCNCKKTKCLKLYCDCFAAGDLCGPECSCFGCHNNQQHKSERNKVVENILDRNPEAFNGKIIKNKVHSKTHTKGCNCRKSGCQKKYCECFGAGIKCNELCKCEECKNCDQDILKNPKILQMQKLLGQDKSFDFLKGQGFLLIPTNNEMFKQFQGQMSQMLGMEPQITKYIKQNDQDEK